MHLLKREHRKTARRKAERQRGSKCPPPGQEVTGGGLGRMPATRKGECEAGRENQSNPNKMAV